MSHLLLPSVFPDLSIEIIFLTNFQIVGNVRRIKINYSQKVHAVCNSYFGQLLSPPVWALIHILDKTAHQLALSHGEIRYCHRRSAVFVIPRVMVNKILYSPYPHCI